MKWRNKIRNRLANFYDDFDYKTQTHAFLLIERLDKLNSDESLGNKASEKYASELQSVNGLSEHADIERNKSKSKSRRKNKELPNNENTILSNDLPKDDYHEKNDLEAKKMRLMNGVNNYDCSNISIEFDSSTNKYVEAAKRYEGVRCLFRW